MHRIPNHQGWKQREAIAKAKALVKADPRRAEIDKVRGYGLRRDNILGEVSTAEDMVARTADQLARAKSNLAVYEAYSLQNLKVHTSLVSGRMEVEAAELLLGVAEKQLAAVKARLAAAEDQFTAAQSRFSENMAALDADGAAEVEVVPKVEAATVMHAPAAAHVVATVPARVDAGVSLSDDDALAALEPITKRSRRR